MLDAARLAMSDGMGILWKPASLSDIYDTPARVLDLFDHYRLGAAAREMPWDWWRPRGSRSHAHQYPASFVGVPDAPARCGIALPEGEMERTGGQHQCPACQRHASPDGAGGSGTGAVLRIQGG